MMSMAQWAVVAIFGPALPTLPTLPTVLYAQISIPSLSEIAQSILVSAPFLTVEAAISRMVAHGMTPHIVTHMVTHMVTHRAESGTMGKHATANLWRHREPYDSYREP